MGGRGGGREGCRDAGCRMQDAGMQGYRDAGCRDAGMQDGEGNKDNQGNL
jgi:hypothetical protein